MTELGAFGKALEVALPHVQPIFEALINFDPMGILGAIVGLGGLLDQGTFKEMMKIGVQVGFFTKIANAIPFKKEYSLFGFTFRLV